MLRLLFAGGLLLFGFIQAFRGPFYALLLYLGIAYFRPETWIWSGELRSLNISFLAGLMAVTWTFFSVDRFRFTLPMWLIAAFCFHGLVATVLSPTPAWCYLWWQGFAKVTVITILIIGLVNTQERMRLTLVVLSFALGFEGVKQGWVHLISAPEAQNINAIEILGDNNGVAVGMLMLAAILLALFQTHPTKRLRPVFGFMVLGVVFRSLTSYSRGGLLAFAAMSMAYIVRSKHFFRTALLVGSLGLALLPLLPEAYWDRMRTITTEDEEADSSVQGRYHFWYVARLIAADHPVLGVGTSGFQAVYNAYDPTRGAFGRNRAVHSMWFGLLADQGYVGFMLFCTIFALALRAGGRARALAKGRPELVELFAYGGACQTALITVAVGGSFLSYHYVEVLWHFIGFSFAAEAIAVRATRTETVTAPAWTAQRRPAFGSA